MYATFLFLHILGAIIMGFYLLLPFVSGKLVNSGSSPQVGAIGILSTFNRIGQFGLILEFVTGGYMVGQAFKNGQVSVLWMILAVALLIALGAVSGILGVTLKRLASGNHASQQLGKAKALIATGSIVYLIIIIIMTNRSWFV
jgi:hypothetical protein